MVKISDEFGPIFDKIREMQSYVTLLEQELATERQETKRLRALVHQMKEHAQLLVEEAERGEPIASLDGVPLELITPSVRDELSLKLAVVEKQAQTSNPGNGVTPDWLVAAMPTQQLPPHDTVKLPKSLADSYMS